jgi:hypothetical protein
MKLKVPGKASYEVTADDRLWLLRAVQAEGAPRVGIARALVNLFVLLRSRGSAVAESLMRLVRAYSQPVNPIWAQGGRKDSDPSEVSAAERRRAAAAVRVVFDDSVVAAVNAALTSDYKGDVTDFAAPHVDATSKGYVRRGAVAQGFNTLWTREPGWPGYELEGGTMDIAEKILLLARTFPPNERVQVERAVERLRAAVGANALLDGVKVIRPGEPGFDEAKANAVQPVEWDLAAANTLDALYVAVKERAEELANAAYDKVGKPALGLLLALALVWMLLNSRRD